MKEVQSTDVIKFAAEAYMGMGGSPTKLLIEAAEWLYDCYEKTGDTLCVEAAVQVVYAYAKLGLIRDEKQNIFDVILENMGQNEAEIFGKGKYAAKKVGLKQSKICEVLGRWPQASKNQYSAEWVANDIITRVSDGILGCQYYEKGKSKVAFELLVLQDDAYLLDLAKKKIYILEKEIKGTK